MRIIFVIGPPCAGKSYYIRENFPNATVVDLWDYQKDVPVMTVDTISESYRLAENALVNALKNAEDDDTVILEHTLLKAKRRKEYIDVVRDVTDAPIECHVMLPDMKRYRRNCKQRGYEKTFGMEAFELLEVPSESEFDAVVIVQ